MALNVSEDRFAQYAKRRIGVLGFLRGAFMFLLLTVTGLLVNIMQVCTLPILPFSRRLFRILNKNLADLHWGLVVFSYSVWAGTEVTLIGDEIPHGESAVVMLNHRGNTDWTAGWAIAWDRSCLGGIRVVIKAIARFIPIFGWTQMFVETIYVHRDWKNDQGPLLKATRSLSTCPKPMWFVIFPEGTRITPEKLAISHEHARANDKPIFNNVLLPRSKGFVTTVQGMRDNVPYIIDATIVFPDWEPGLIDMFCGCGKARVIVHANIIPLNSLPEDEEGLREWLLESFAKKDKLIGEIVEARDFDHKKYAIQGEHMGYSSYKLFIAWMVFLIAGPALGMAYGPVWLVNVIWWSGVTVAVMTPLILITLGSALALSSYGKTNDKKSK